MKTQVDCIPCFLRQALEAARHITDEQDVHEAAVRRTAREISRMDMEQPPPVMGGFIHRTVRELTGVEDPYRASKEECNRTAMALYPEMKERIDSSADPLETALRLAIAGNVIDFSVNPDADSLNIRSAIDEILVTPFPTRQFAEFREAVSKNGGILYLGDNAGEVVFDRLLIELLPTDRITFVVRGVPTINDVTRHDTQAVGISDLVEVVDNGSDIPGTLLESCSESFRLRFEQADLIISKGQGNYECLSEADKDIFFVFKAKCSSVATYLGCPIGAPVLHRTRG